MSQSTRTHKHEKLARIYDEEILPIWAQRFGRMMLRGLTIPPKSMILDVACGTGYPALEIVRRMDEQSRLVAIDSSSAMLDVARKKAGDLAGKRILFRTEDAAPKLSFASDVYDIVLCNLGLAELPNPRAILRDFVRVAKPRGQVMCTLPLAGTWGELYDIYREVLIKHDKHEILARLEQHVSSIPAASDVESWAQSVGLTDVHVDVEEFSLLFRSSREFFFAPIVEYGPLVRWKEIAGKGQELQDVFWYIKQAIDAYFGGRAFQITVKAGCLHGTKSDQPEATVWDNREDTGGGVDKEPEWYSVQTGEVELVEHLAKESEAKEHEVPPAEELEAFREPPDADADPDADRDDDRDADPDPDPDRDPEESE